MLLMTSIVYNLVASPKKDGKLYPKLNKYCKERSMEFDSIDATRKIELQELATYLVEQRDAKKTSNIMFVCTSNSRRSHMSQVWLQTAAAYYKVPNIYTFSGGTEQTRVNEHAISALRRAGFEIYSNNQAENPLQYVRIAEQSNPWAIFSKKYTDSTNPKTNFAAIMVCTEADKACPLVDGADIRIAIPYQDPKAFDKSTLRDAKYDERCRQIAREMFYVMSLVSKRR